VAIGERHQRAYGDQSLHHLFVTAINIVGGHIGGCGVPAAVSICHGNSSSVKPIPLAGGDPDQPYREQVCFRPDVD
jgi:hypothetical protein